jgi:hypothetical protein
LLQKLLCFWGSLENHNQFPDIITLSFAGQDPRICQVLVAYIILFSCLGGWVLLFLLKILIVGHWKVWQPVVANL